MIWGVSVIFIFASNSFSSFFFFIVGMAGTKKSLFNNVMERKHKGKKLDLYPSKKPVRDEDHLPPSSRGKSTSSRPSHLSRSSGMSRGTSLEMASTEIRSKTNQDRPSKTSRGESTLPEPSQAMKDTLLSERPPRRALLSEKDHRILPPTLSHPIREGQRLVINPGLLDTDSVDMKGVAHRLIYGTILPQDESQIFL